MRPRLNINVALGVALLAACAALYAWSPAVALLSLGFALAGFAAARLLRPVGSTDEAARSLNSTRAPEAATPNVSAAVASGEVPAAALLDVTMDSMREGVVVIDSAMRVVALNNSARDVFHAAGADSLGARRLSDLTRNPAIYSAFAAAVARGARRGQGRDRARRGQKGLRPARRAPAPARGRLRQRRARRGRRLLRHHAARTPRTSAAGVPLERLARAAHAPDGHHRLRRDARRRGRRRPRQQPPLPLNHPPQRRAH